MISYRKYDVKLSRFTLSARAHLFFLLRENAYSLLRLTRKICRFSYNLCHFIKYSG